MERSEVMQAHTCWRMCDAQLVPWESCATTERTYPVGVDDHIDLSRSAIVGTLLIGDWSEVVQAFRRPMVALIILFAGIPAGGLTFCAHRK